jgi:Osmosensitive K+ channel histidine kinase
MASRTRSSCLAAPASVCATVGMATKEVKPANPWRAIPSKAPGQSDIARGDQRSSAPAATARSLASNAIKYGAPDTPVKVVLTGEQEEVRLEVMNSGPVIKRSALDQIFDPLRRGPDQRESHISTRA